LSSTLSEHLGNANHTDGNAAQDDGQVVRMLHRSMPIVAGGSAFRSATRRLEHFDAAIGKVDDPVGLDSFACRNTSAV
jgi:hypothetical protein